jgi:hypothetical protein
MKEASRRFLPIGHLYERTTKTGNPYLTEKIADQQVFLFLQDDGSWKVFLQVEETRAPAAEAPALSDDEVFRMRFLRESAVERVMEGITTLREINKVTFVE